MIEEVPIAATTWEAQLGASERQQQQHYDTIAIRLRSALQRRVERRIPSPVYLRTDVCRIWSCGASGAGCDVWQWANDELPARTWRECDGFGHFKRGTSTLFSRVGLGLMWGNDRLSIPDCRTTSFDCVAVVGGLHHIHPNVKAAVREIHRVLKPGGHFCFMEPHKWLASGCGAKGLVSFRSFLFRQ